MEKTRYWVGVIAADHAVFAASEGVCAFSHGKEAPVAKLRPGDGFAYYSPKTGVNEGDPVQAFTAVGVVTGEVAYQKTWAETEFTAWVRDASYAPDAQPAAVRPLLEALEFVTNPRNWGMAFRRGQFEISQKDFSLIAHAMGVPPQWPK